MIVVMKKEATDMQIQSVIQQLERIGLRVYRQTGESGIILGIIGDTSRKNTSTILSDESIAHVHQVKEPYRLAGRSFHPFDTLVTSSHLSIGGNEIIIMAGPCSVENEDQIHTIARSIRKGGAKILRGGAFKPRTSPYSFQGLGELGLHYLSQAATENGMLSVSEVMDVSTIDLVARYVDILQIGARNMPNFTLLKELGKVNKPVLLKRGMAATIEDLLMAAEYIIASGNPNVILCERGIRTFETYTRNTMDISAIPVVKKRSHLPIIADPSHGIGIRDNVAAMARAAIAAGADGLIIEVHNDPDHALSDGAQSLLPKQFVSLMDDLRIISWAVGRFIGSPSMEGVS